MTPPEGFSSQMNTPQSSVVSANVFEFAQRDDTEHLTFEELRELPMRLALSFDSSLDH